MSTTRDNHDVVVRMRDEASQGVRKLNSSFGTMVKSVATVATAYLGWQAATGFVKDAIVDAAKYEATLISLDKVALTTGRDVNEIYSEMGKHLGSLASKASVAQGFLRGLTTTLTVKQISELTTAVKNASIAMGEDFNVQLPMIIKAIKTLSPNVVDNIGVTVRLDEVNKKLRDGYYGVNKALTEATQQQAIYSEIMQQTAKYEGLYEQFLTTTQGRLEKIKVAYEDLKIAAGDVAIGFDDGDVTILDGIYAGLKGITAYIGHTATMIGLAANVFADFKDIAVTGIEEVLFSLKKLGSLFVSLVTFDMDGVKNALNSLSFAGEDVSSAVRVLQMDLHALATEGRKTAKDIEAAFNAALPKAAPEKKALETSEQRWQRHFDELMAMEQQFVFTDLPPLVQQGADAELHATALVAAEFAASREAMIASEEEYARRGNQITDRMMDSIISDLFAGRLSMQRIWQQMAEDLTKFFIKQALKDIGELLVPGILRMLGSLFDTPANDRMAMREGARYAMFFTRGVTDGLQSFTPMMGSMAAAGAGASYGTPMSITVNISGNADESVVNKIIPAIEQAATNFTSRIALTREMSTGGALRVV